MGVFDPKESFNAKVAATYDDAPRGDEEAAVEFLSRLARGGTALEFAIGTGRIALPLSAAGIPVDGIELSDAMISRLREKPGGSEVNIWPGDMSGLFTGHTYALVYLVCNTIFNITTQEGQVKCFANAARHLDEDGVFVIETAVPSDWVHPNAYARPEKVAVDGVVLDVCKYDPVTQILSENHVTIREDGITLAPIECRLAWPSELDLMAQLAGLKLIDRWGSWDKQPYTGQGVHISVYARS